jgi:hypothetical protein
MMAGEETAVVWFNGPSVRQFLDIPRQPLEIGCNFIEQHRDVDHVCAYDRQCIERIAQRSGVQYWTRQAMRSGSWPAPESTYQPFDSGTLAVVVAHQLRVKQINIMGCDWQHTNESVFDGAYTWRNYQPKKASLPKQKLLERIHLSVPITIVTDRPWRMAVNFQSPKDYLGSIN